MQQKAQSHQNDRKLALFAQPVKPAETKKQEAIRILERVAKRRLKRKFDQLSLGSIDYKRSLQIKREQDKFRRQSSLDRLHSILRRREVVSKTKAFCKWRESVTHSSGSSKVSLSPSTSVNHELSGLLSQIKEL